MKTIYITYPGPITSEELNEVKETLRSKLQIDVEPVVVDIEGMDSMISIDIRESNTTEAVKEIERVNDYLCAYDIPLFDKKNNRWLNFYNQ